MSFCFNSDLPWPHFQHVLLLSLFLHLHNKTFSLGKELLGGFFRLPAPAWFPLGTRTLGCFSSLLWFLKNLLLLQVDDSMQLLLFCTSWSKESFQASNKAVHSALIPPLLRLRSDKWMEELSNQQTSAGLGKQAERRRRRPVNKKNKCISQLGRNCPPLLQPPWGAGRRRGSILLAAVQC